MPTTFLKNPVHVNVTSGAVGLHVVGTPAEATIAGGNQPANSLTVLGTTGQETTGTGLTGGDGADISITGGTGGAAPTGSTNGAGGTVTINPGSPGTGGGIAAKYGHVLLASEGGNVGIGTAVPQEKLHISGSDVAIRFKGTGTGGKEWLFQTVDGNGRFRIYSQSNNAERVTVLDNGNVGIGTNAPGAKLHVGGTASVDANLGLGTTSPANKLHLAGSDVAIRIQGTGSGGKEWLLQTVDANGRLRLFSQTNNVERLSILDNGNLGVGTNAPAQKLHVAGSAIVDANVGIGTSSPGQKLHLAGSDVAIRLQGTGSGGKEWLLQTVDGNGRLRLFSQSNNIERLTVLDGGSVGIGTTSPTSTLHVNGGMQVGAPTGGDKGTGSINISGDIYKNGAPLLAKLEKAYAQIAELVKRLERLEKGSSRLTAGKSAPPRAPKKKSATKSSKKKRNR